MSKRPESARVAAISALVMRTFADGVVSDVEHFAAPTGPLRDWPSLAFQLALMVQRLAIPMTAETRCTSCGSFNVMVEITYSAAVKARRVTCFRCGTKTGVTCFRCGTKTGETCFRCGTKTGEMEPP